MVTGLSGVHAIHFFHLFLFPSFSSCLCKPRWMSSSSLSVLSMANTGLIFKKLELLKLHDIHLFQLVFFMFSFKNSTLPSKFNNLFFTNSQIYNYNTGMPILFACLCVEQTPDCFQFISKVQSFTVL